MAKELAGQMRTESKYSKKELISSLRQSCQRHLESVFVRFFEQASQTLLEMASKAETNRLQTIYLDAQRLLRSRRAEVETGVTEQVLMSFSTLTVAVAPKVAETNGHNTPYNHLELLGNEDLEVMIALDNGSTKALETFKGPLYLLQRRFETMLGGPVASPVPMSPDALMEALAESIADGMIAVEMQVVLINLFNQICFDRSYGLLLDSVNVFLEEGGVYPAAEDDPQHTPVAARSGERCSPEPIKSPEPIDSPEPIKSPEPIDSPEPIHSPEPIISPQHQTKISAVDTQQLQSVVDKLSPNNPSPIKPAASRTVDLKPADTSTRVQTELLGRISAILEANQVQPMDANSACLGKQQLFDEIDRHIERLLTGSSAGTLESGQMSQQLEQAINGAQPEGKRVLHRNDASVFHVVGSTFSRFSRASAMAPDAQQVIGRCELPLLKLALDKPELLEQENHPIRRLFNEMANYAISLEQGDCADNKIYQQMLGLSEQMLSESFNEQRIPRMLTEFMTAVDEDRRVSRLQEQRQLEEIAATEKINWAYTRVETEISRRLIGSQMPVAIINFVEQHWCKVLHIAHLRGGESSNLWTDGLNILDRLLRLLQLDLADRDTARVEQVLQNIDHRLQHIAIDEVQRKDQMDRLQFILSPVLPNNVTDMDAYKKVSADRDHTDQVKHIVISSLASEMPGENITATLDRVEGLDASAQDSLSAVQKGCWIELSDGIKTARRGKLAGIVGPTWKYVFVNNKGKLVAEKNRASLAEELQQGQVTVLDNSQLFDKAIKAAINDVKDLSVAI